MLYNTSVITIPRSRICLFESYIYTNVSILYLDHSDRPDILLHICDNHQWQHHKRHLNSY